MRVLRAVAALSLQVREELEPERRVELLERQCRGRYAEPLRREGEEQLERVRVGVDGVPAGLALLRQPLAEVGGEVRGEWRHGRPPVSEGRPDPVRDVAHQAGRRLQVPVGVGDVRVSEVGREREHVLGDAVAAVGTRLESAHGEGVPDVVDAWLRLVRRLLETGELAHLDEHLARAVVGEALPARAEEQAGWWRADGATALLVAVESLSRSLMQWDQARLLELRLADEQPLRRHVIQVERHRLRDTQPRRKQQREEGLCREHPHR